MSINNNLRPKLQLIKMTACRNIQQGFTLIELVIVLAVLAILAAIAFPRFLDVTTQAHESAVAGAGSAFGTAVQLARAHWVANGADKTVLDDVPGFANGDVDVGGVGMTVAGFPTDTNGANAIPSGSKGDAQCVNIWSAIMQVPFTIQAAGGTADVDYNATAGTNSCTYIYNSVQNMSISYDASTGKVIVDSDSSS